MYIHSRPEELKSFIKRLDATIPDKSAYDMWMNYLSKNQTGGGSLFDLETRFLRSKGGTGSTHADVVNSYLNTKGYKGTVAEKVRGFTRKSSAW